MIELTISIVSYNAREDLARCLAALRENTSDVSTEIVVVDNASADGSFEMLAERFPEVLAIQNRENAGFARASNAGWRRGQAAFVLFLNGDALVTPHAVETMLELLKARPDVGAVGPRLTNPDGSVQLSFGRMMSFGAELRQKLVNAAYRNGSGPLRRYIEKRYGREQDCDWVSGACLMTRRALLNETGGFDENFFMYSEDVDLCARIRSAGYRVLFTPAAEVTHLLGRSAASNRETAIVESHRSRLYFYRKHYGGLRVGLLKLYLAAKISLSYLWAPGSRPTARKIFRLLQST